MRHIKILLGLIEEGDAVTILSQENIVIRLNELFKLEFINFKDGEIFLSKKGKEFKNNVFILPQNFHPDTFETEFS